MNARIQEINSRDQFERIIEVSHRAPVVLFKHSASCGISSNVLSEIRNLDAEVNVVVVQNSRDVSNEIASRLNLRHETPQAIVLLNGRAVYSASHYNVSSDEIVKILKSEARS
jgi:bacillithiol system protein YtxJ